MVSGIELAGRVKRIDEKSVADKFDSINGRAIVFGAGFFGITRQYPQPPYCFSASFQRSFAVSCRSLRYFTQASRCFRKSWPLEWEYAWIVSGGIDRIVEPIRTGVNTSVQFGEFREPNQTPVSRGLDDMVSHVGIECLLPRRYHERR